MKTEVFFINKSFLFLKIARLQQIMKVDIKASSEEGNEISAN